MIHSARYTYFITRILFTGLRRTIYSSARYDLSNSRILIPFLWALLPNSGHKIRSIHTSMALNTLHTVFTPQFADSISEGDINWQKEVGDSVEVDEVIGEIETDKTAMPIMSPINGVIKSFLIETGATVTPGMELATIEETTVAEESGTQTSIDTPAAEFSKPEEAYQASPPIDDQAEPILPPDTDPIQPPNADVLTQEDKIADSPPPPMQAMPSVNIVTETQSDQSSSRTERRVKMTRMRQRIGERLKESQRTYAMLTTFNEVDMTNVIQMRKKFNDNFENKHGVKLGIMSPFVKAAAYALQNQPTVNAVIDGSDIVYRNFIDIAVAVATPKGLVVPVIRNIENMNYSDIEKKLHELGVQARDNTLPLDDLYGGTFTVSNGGVFGSLFGTPIINPPQSSILGMHGTFERPIALNGEVVIRPMMYLALTYDHRLIDGREAVLFLRKIKSVVEDPVTMLLDI